MSNFSKAAALMSMVFLTVTGMFSSDIFTTWVLMELITMLFLGIMAMSLTYSKKSATMVFFLSQSFSSVMFLVVYFMSVSSGLKLWGYLLEASMILKMGLIPFHFWAIALLTYFSWEMLFYFLTILKFLPLVILEGSASSNLFFFVMTNWVGGAVFSAMVQNLKLMMMFSSMFFMGMIMWLAGTGVMLWVKYLIMYCFLLSPLMLIMSISSKKKFSLALLGGGYSAKLVLVFSLLSLAGLPPLPGFFLKLDFLLLLQPFSLVLGAVFLSLSVAIMYMYLSASLWSLAKSSHSPLPGAPVSLLYLFWFLTLTPAMTML